MENQFEEELHQNKVLQSLYHRAKIHSLLVTDREGYVLHLNETFQHTFGYTLEKVRGQHGRIFFTEEDRLKMVPEQEIKLVNEQGSSRDRNYIVHQDGSQLWSDGESLLIERSEGQAFILKIIQNIHEQKVLEQTLTEASQFSSHVLDSISEGLLVINRELKILKANRCLGELLKIQDPVEGRYLYELGSSLFSEPGTRLRLEKILQSGESEDFEVNFVSPQDGVKNLAVQTSFLFKDHEKTKLLLVVSDITLQRNAWHRIETEVTERTEELKHTNQALTIANEALHQSNTNLSQFAYAASHDLKEPVRKIHLFASHLKSILQERLKHEEQRYFERLESTARRMSHMIDELLSYAQVSMEPLQLQPVALNEVLRQVVQDLDVVVEQKGAQIIVDDLPVVAGHFRQLQQVFQNLLTNAVKFQPKGNQPIVTIRSRTIAGEELPFPVASEVKCYNLIEVTDNGIGFSPEEGEGLFKVFHRLHGQSEYEGSGIGLSIVQRIVQNHKGTVEAKGEEGKGATFQVILPQLQEAEKVVG